MKTQNNYPFPSYNSPRDIPTMRPLDTAKGNRLQEAAKERARTEVIARKLTDENRTFLLNKATILGVGIVHVFDESAPKGGMTIAFRKVSPFPAGVMVEVAVATCSKEDSFSRKTGTKLALEAFFDEKVIRLPLSNPASKEGLSTQVKWAFEGMFYAM